MQLVCQRNSLNLHSFAVQEIAELSEILTVQKHLARAATERSLLSSDRGNEDLQTEEATVWRWHRTTRE
jgi:hypothetical protein